jgi:hypothetical protein
VIALFVRNCPLDLDELERIEDQGAVMTLWVGQAGDCIEDRLINGVARTGRHHDVLVLMMFRHEVPPRVSILLAELPLHPSHYLLPIPLPLICINGL